MFDLLIGLALAILLLRVAERMPARIPVRIARERSRK
jgi:hypothetical protein